LSDEVERADCSDILCCPQYLFVQYNFPNIPPVQLIFTVFYFVVIMFGLRDTVI